MNPLGRATEPAAHGDRRMKRRVADEGQSSLNCIGLQGRRRWVANLDVSRKVKYMFRSAAVLGIALLLAACAPADDFTRQKIAARRAAAEQTHEMARSPETVQKFLSDTTAKVWNAHGTQIEYLAANGETFLWYPGNAAAVEGRWKLQMTRYGLEMCFLYGKNSRNPLAGQQGGQWECDMAAYYLLNRDEIVDGDPLRLARGLPFVMPSGANISIAQAMSRAGLGQLRASNKAMAPQVPGGN